MQTSILKRYPPSTIPKETIVSVEFMQIIDAKRRILSIKLFGKLILKF